MKKKTLFLDYFLSIFMQEFQDKRMMGSMQKINQTFFSGFKIKVANVKENRQLKLDYFFFIDP